MMSAFLKKFGSAWFERRRKLPLFTTPATPNLKYSMVARCASGGRQTTNRSP